MIINGYPLDENQMKPILENPKYSLIIAGAGSDFNWENQIFTQ